MTTLTVFQGWQLDTSDAEEPRVRDLDVASRGGLKSPHDIRRLIDRHTSTLLQFGELRVLGTVPKNGRGRPGREFWLNEHQAIWLASRLETVEGLALSVSMTKMYVAYRRGQLAPAHAPVVLDVAHGVRVGDLPQARAELSDACTVAARASRCTLASVHGAIRKAFRIPGVYHLSALLLPTARVLLNEIATGRFLLAKARIALPRSSDNQLLLPLN